MDTSVGCDVVTYLDQTVDAVRARVALRPRLGVVLGSGLGGFGERLRNVTKIPYRDLPHMPVPRMAGHAGNLCVGYVDDVPVICLEGRAHTYEGYPIWQVVHGVRVMARLGVHAVLLTNAAAALDPSWANGTLMAIVDHIDLMAHEPVVDLPHEHVVRAPDMRDAYEPALRDELHAAAHAENLLSARTGQNVVIQLREGVYAALRDPSCETPAQVRMLAMVGAHAIGASTAPEVTALRQMGVRVAGLSYIARTATGLGPDVVEEETTPPRSLAQFQRLIRAWLIRADRV